MKILRIKNSKEVGSASIIFVLLTSLAITASTTSVIQSIRNTKEIGIAVNAVTHAQTGLWAGTEAFRRYLQSADLEELDIQGLRGNLDITMMDPSYGTITAENITSEAISGVDNAYRVTAKIVNLHAVSKSSASHEVVFNVVGSPAGGADNTPTVHFNDSVSFNGGIELLNNGEPVDLNVNGDVNFGGVGINLINSVNSTGTVTLNSNVAINSIYAEEDVILNSSIIQTVETLGTLTTTGSTTVQNVWANDDVIIGSSGHFENVNSVRNILVGGGGTQGTLTAGETIELNNTKMADSANAVGNISTTWSATAGDMVSMADITCPSEWWTKVSSISANGTINNCPPNGRESISVVENAGRVVAPMRPLKARSITPPIINVWNLKDDANYFVYYDSIAKQIKVTVNHMNGVVDGTELILGDYPRVNHGPPTRDYLCESVDSSGMCTAPSTPAFPLCFANGPWNNSCISYDQGTNTFDINPSNTAPGIMFFDGNLKVRGGGRGATSFLASGDIEAGQGSSFVGWAANFGGYPIVCEANADHLSSAQSLIRTRYTTAFTAHYPTNLCDIANSEYTPIAAGNIGLAAGGVNPDLTVNPSELYEGGNIDLTSNANVTGLVLAGNFLNTTGDVTIKGLVSAGAYANTPGGGNELNGSTTIDLNDANEDFDPADKTLVGNSAPPELVFSATMLWGRAL